MSSDPMYAIVETVRVENPEEARKVLQQPECRCSSAHRAW